MNWMLRAERAKVSVELLYVSYRFVHYWDLDVKNELVFE